MSGDGKGNEVKGIEEKWKKYWEREKIYSFDSKGKKKIYSIDTPPPNVSGAMHMGHAFSYSQQDFIARYKRMRGFNVFYPFGTDDNGLPTEKLIQSLKKVNSKDMAREEFIKLCLKTLKEILPELIQDWKNLAISCDYNIYYSTIDNYSRKISQKSFIELYKKGLIYKKEFPAIWDSVFQTSVAQAELEDKEKETLFSTLKFKLKEKGGDLLIATTRPELLGACVAVFVNPEDKRYKKLIGKNVEVPLFDYSVPIIEDDSAEMEKGTGVLMICSYGDKYDVDAVQRHKLKPRIVLNKDGTLKEGKYNGLSIEEARKQILDDLKNKGLIVKQERIKHIVNVYEKSGKEIEFIPTEQWFIKILDRKNDLIKQGRKIKWIPEHMIKRYENWVNGLDWDWIISRERHFGIPIPVWKCENCGEIILAEEKELPVDPVQVRKKCKKCKLEAKPELKVLDTWATSSLTWQIASEIPEVKGKVKLPYSLRPQGHDIIRTWAFYTIVKTLYHEKQIPWNEIVISGNVRFDGEKMSKSKGNVIAPQDIMERYGTDALRYWAASSKLGEDIEYNENDVIAGKKFVTKLLNAARFIFLNIKNRPLIKEKNLLEMDKWKIVYYISPAG
ncbi:MAG: valine--tRNA ligase, partial [Nanoarchaeota archaeon]